MYILATDTAFGNASICIKKDNETLALVQDFNRESQAEKLINLIQDCLKSANLNYNQIDLYSANIGPGSFTGIRIGLSAVKAISYALKKPFIGVTSFEAHIQNFTKKAEISAERVYSIINANRDEIYIFEFDKRGLIDNLSNGKLINVADLESLKNPECFFISDNLKIHSYLVENNFNTYSSSI
ncbi:MAG: tRNA (adenosine(37)-N6)-threonylcarbamoyltransferase complex dimerization subunit type 1 TsaB, partial [Rickettsiales bacterium]|nr:tRNA (adenosine(37)-N6)-threonylcarbamoyltransferase complex dimerization subunit type 1 TsaB [Rickettsiales bacterium]